MGGKGSGVHKYTYEQLSEAHFRQTVKLSNARTDAKFWKKRAQEAEEKLESAIFIDKKPDYFFSFSGHLIFRRWYILNGLTAFQAEILIIVSYCDVFLTAHFKLFRRNYIGKLPDQFKKLVTRGYLIKVEVPGKTKAKKRIGYVLTKLGKDFETDYEKFYDKTMEEFKTGQFTHFNFEDGQYFRKRYVKSFERRRAQGGGMLKRARVDEIWVPANPTEYEKNRNAQ